MTKAPRHPDTPCARCATPGTLYLCTTCLLAFRIQLGDVAGTLAGPRDDKPHNLPSLLEDLDVTASRQDRITTNPRTRTLPGSGVLPYRPTATEALWVLHNVLTKWVPDLGGPTTGTPHDLTMWLLTNLTRVTTFPHAGLLVDEITDAISLARHTIDRPRDRRVFLGRCAATTPTNPYCPAELFGILGQHTARCETCGTEHDITDRQDQLRARASWYIGTATDIARCLRATGMDVTSEMIRGYAHRKHLTPAPGEDGVNERGHPRYRISDVLEVLSTVKSRPRKPSL